MKSNEYRPGRKTIAALVDLMKDWSRAEIRKVLFDHNLNKRFQGDPRIEALGNVFYPMVDDSERQRYMKMYATTGYWMHDDSLFDSDAEANDTKDLIEYFTKISLSSYGGEEQIEVLRKALRADGFDLDDEGRVVPFLSPEVDPRREQGLLESRLSDARFEIARNHFIQAVDNAGDGNWESANSQIRSFLEALCDVVAECLYEGSGEAPKRGDARKLMQDRGFLSKNESCLLGAFFAVLHGEGSHPGKSSETDCHRRRLMAVALANYYLDRLDEWPKRARA